MCACARALAWLTCGSKLITHGANFFYFFYESYKGPKQYY